MQHVEKKWFVRTKKADFQAIAARFHIDQVTARLLRNRDIVTDEEIEAYLHGSLNDLADEALLPDMEQAKALILQKIAQKKRIRIVGDYDIDGVCAAYILYRGLAHLGAEADYVIPDRIKDGYGINMHIIDQAIADGVDTIVTCDNGIAALEELAHAKVSGLSVVVTDHHEIRKDEDGQESLPEADAIVDPKRSTNAYPEPGICGAVVAWLLVHALFKARGIGDEVWHALLEFAAIATVGDVMPLRGMNRVIVREGLARINRGADNTGLRCLIEACGLAEKKLTSYHIGFVIGPCINAGGRLESAELALSLFLTKGGAQAEAAALRLKALNDERKEMTEQGTREAAAAVEAEYLSDKVLVVYLPKLHESLAGIVAGRLREQFGKPAFVITNSENGLKGSGRSIEAYHMFNGLCEVADLLSKFGGHPMAAGLSLPPENLEAFRRRINENAKLTEADFVQKVWIDVPMPLSYVTENLIGELARLEPFGQGNEKPVFAERGVEAAELRVLGKNRNVLRMMLREQNGNVMPGILFGDADALKEEIENKRLINILYYPEINEYRGYRSLQAVITDFC